MIVLSKSWVDSFGYIAAFCTTVAFVPQVISVLRLRSAREISLSWILIFTFGVAMWLAYGLSLHSWPIIASNAVTLLLAITILILKLYYSERNRT